MSNYCCAEFYFLRSHLVLSVLWLQFRTSFPFLWNKGRSESFRYWELKTRVLLGLFQCVKIIRIYIAVN